MQHLRMMPLICEMSQKCPTFRGHSNPYFGYISLVQKHVCSHTTYEVQYMWDMTCATSLAQRAHQYPWWGRADLPDRLRRRVYQNIAKTASDPLSPPRQQFRQSTPPPRTQRRRHRGSKNGGNRAREKSGAFECLIDAATTFLPECQGVQKRQGTHQMRGRYHGRCK